jgi:hypothetical protein
MIQNEFPGVTVIANSENLGIAARNMAIAPPPQNRLSLDDDIEPRTRTRFEDPGVFSAPLVEPA